MTQRRRSEIPRVSSRDKRRDGSYPVQRYEANKAELSRSSLVVALPSEGYSHTGILTMADGLTGFLTPYRSDTALIKSSIQDWAYGLTTTS